MANFGFIIDNRRCIGCHACTVACKSEHQVPVGVNRTWVKYIEKGEFPNSKRVFSVMRCNHCDNAPCVEICPVTALYRREDGIVDFDNRRCIGCKACMQACPYDALYIDPETSTAAKCNYCAHRIDVGLEPACVNVCPTQAIISGDLDDPNSNISQTRARNQVTARRTEKGTEPSLFYIKGDVDALEPTATPTESNTMWGGQVSGVGHFADDHGSHALDRLGSLLNLGDRPEMINEPAVAEKPAAGLVQIGEQRAENLLQAVAPKSSRVYDAPQKGVLWGWQVSGYLWTKSVSAGACILPLLAMCFGVTDIGHGTLIAGLLTALVFLGLTGLLLVWDLDKPTRFLSVLLRPQWRSWLVKGAYIITVFSGLLVAYSAVTVFDANYGVLEAVLRVPLMISAVLAAVYTAFLFAQAKGRDFWQSPILPFHMLAHAMIAGSAVFAMVMPVLGGTDWQRFVVVCLIVSIVARALCDLIELYSTHPTVSASKAAAEIRSGRYRNLFWAGVMVVGTLLPLAIVLISGASVLLSVAGLMALVGVFIAEHLWVRAPQLIPLS